MVWTWKLIVYNEERTSCKIKANCASLYYSAAVYHHPLLANGLHDDIDVQSGKEAGGCNE